MTGDILPVLRSLNRKYATKRISMTKSGVLNIISYGSEKYFRIEEHQISGFGELSVMLVELAEDPFAFVIRGAPLNGINRNRTRRLQHPDRKTGDPAAFTEAPRHWFSLDGDHLELPALTDPAFDPEAAVEYVIGLLPPDLHDASLYWQLTSSTALPGSEGLISLRMWGWNSTPLSNAELKRWAAAANHSLRLVDPALFTPVQPHYVAAPIFDRGMKDPLRRRWGIRQGLVDEVCLVIPPPDLKNPEMVSGQGYEPGRGVEAYLAEIGGGQGFRAPLRSAIASYIATYGSTADCTRLKEAIRAAVDRADPGGRPPEVIEHYKSDEHLDQIITWVRQHHGDQPPKTFIGDPPPWLDEAPAAEPTPEAATSITAADFWAYLPMHKYIFEPTRELWPKASVNARLGEVFAGQPASYWLDDNKPVEQMTWAPGEPLVIRDRVASEGGWIERADVSCFNLYRPPPALLAGDPRRATKWLEHVERVYPDDAEHIRCWLAHRVQRPAEKINHALVLGGLQGIGKDTLLEPVRRAIGVWNWGEVTPRTMIETRFNSYVKAVILRINEARDLGESSRYTFYDHLKLLTAAPPDMLRVDQKHLQEYYVQNCCGVIITTNYKADGMYLPADDRRHYVAWSSRTKNDFTPDYWTELWGWYGRGGFGHVAAYLATLDLTGFNPKAPPPKTDAFWDIANANRAPEDGELADVLEQLGNPRVVTLLKVINGAAAAQLHTFVDWLRERRNRRLVPHRFEACGYVPVRNDAADDGLWRIAGKRQAIYSRAELTRAEQLAAVSELIAALRYGG